MRVQVDPSRCQGHTLCAMVAPESFDLDDVDGHAHATCEVVLDVHRDQVLEAVTTCPEQAITATVDHLQAPRAAHGDPQEQ